MTKIACLDDILLEVCGFELDSTDGTQNQLLSAQQQLALMNLVKIDDPDAKRQLIAHNLRLVVNIAKRDGDHGVALYDLVREGVQGLIYALNNFELEGYHPQYCPMPIWLVRPT